MSRWQRQREAWSRWASDYDARTARLERWFLASTRPWVCGRAAGDVLEIGVGTGANLPHYAPEVRLIATDHSLDMLDAARRRPGGRPQVSFEVADAMALPYADATFDAVVCTYVLCGVPDVSEALGEMLRVLRPGGSLLLADHVGSSNGLVWLLQRGLESATGRVQGEYWTRRPRRNLETLGVPIVDGLRRHFGVIECVHARKPG